MLRDIRTAVLRKTRCTIDEPLHVTDPEVEQGGQTRYGQAWSDHIIDHLNLIVFSLTLGSMIQISNAFEVESRSLDVGL